MITRRTFLTSLAIVGGAIGAGGLFNVFARDPAEQLREVLSDLPAVDVVGKAYLAQHPEESDPKKLGELLFTGKLSGSYSNGYFRKALDEQIRADYAAGEMVSLNGWMISRTECRVAAFLHLS